MTFTLIVVTYLANVLSASQLTLRDSNWDIAYFQMGSLYHYLHGQ